MNPHDPDAQPPRPIVSPADARRPVRIAKRTGQPDQRQRQRRPILHPLMEAFVTDRARLGRPHVQEKAARMFPLVAWCRDQHVDPVRATAADLGRFRTWMWTEWRTSAGQPCSYHSKRQALGMLRAWYRWLVDAGHRSDDPAVETLSLVAGVDPSSYPTPRYIRTPLHPLMESFLAHHRRRGRELTAQSVDLTLRQFACWCVERAIDPLLLTREQADAYLVWLGTTHTRAGRPLQRSTVSTRIAQLVAWYDWLVVRGDLLANPAGKLHVRIVKSRVVVHEHLNLQEAIALVQTQAQAVIDTPERTYIWARRMRLLAAICLCLATGRRIGGLLAIRVEHLDLERCELRVEREKGRTGRVLPVAAWAIGVARSYLAQARPILAAGRDLPWLFIGNDGAVTRVALGWALEELVRQTAVANPDLTELPGKTVTWHSLRVSFATLLFANGCPIRSVNELMLHCCLSTTARYTPIPIEDMQQIWRTAHPRP